MDIKRNATQKRIQKLIQACVESAKTKVESRISGRACFGRSHPQNWNQERLVLVLHKGDIWMEKSTMHSCACLQSKLLGRQMQEDPFEPGVEG